MSKWHGILEIPTFSEHPSNAESGYRSLYFKDGEPYYKNTSGSVFRLLDDVTAISGRTALTSGLSSTDELLVNDSGTLKRMDISVLSSYLESQIDYDNYEKWTLNADGSSNFITSGKIIEFVGGTNVTVSKTTITGGYKLSFSASGGSSYAFDWNGFTVDSGEEVYTIGGNGISIHTLEETSGRFDTTIKLGELTSSATSESQFAYMAVIDSSWNWKYMTKANLISILGGGSSVSQLNDLSDVTIGGAAEGYVLEQSSDGSWTNVSKSSINLSEFNNDISLGTCSVSTYVKNDFTENALFDFLKAFVSSTNDERLMTGAAVVSGKAYYVISFKRTSSTEISIRYIDEAASPHPTMADFDITDGSSNVPFQVLAVSILDH